MAIRQTRLITKNSLTSNQPLSGATALKGEAVVNLFDGILYYSGASGGGFVSSDNPTSGFFEVGSNLYQLKIRDKITSYSGVTNLSGQFLSGTSTGFVLASISSIQGVDRHVTGFTYDPLTNTFQITQTQGGPTKTATFNAVSGLTVNGDLTVTGNTSLNGTLDVTGNTTINGTTTLNGNVSISGLSPNLVVYTDGSGNLKTKTDFSYLESSDLLTVKNLTVNNTGQTANFGVGGVVIGSGGSVGPSGGTAGTGDLVVHGSLTVFGNSISAFTSNLYIEDNNIILNYNPTGSTASSSVNSGFQIQDGGGTSGNSVNLDVVRLQYLSGVTTAQTPYVLSEYTGNEDNYLGRGWITQLNDIVIRSTDVVDNGVPGSITGVRVLAEFDTLDGGTY